MPSTRESVEQQGAKGTRYLKGLILSGGKGSRLRPFTFTNAKQLVPIANKPVLFYTIEQLVEAGVQDIAVVVGDTAEQIKAAVGDGSAFGANVEYIEQDAPLGLAHAVKIARDYMGESPFVMYLGDNFVLGGIKPFVDSFRENGANCQILLHSVDDPQSFGVAEFASGRVSRILEKPSSPTSNLAVIGVYMFDSNAFEAVGHLKPSARGELEITDTIQWLIDKGLDVRTEVLDRYWIDTGKMGDILEANRVVLQTLTPANRGEVDERTRVYEPVVIEEGARVVNSVLRGPLIIGRDTVVVDSFIGPFTSVDHGCRLKGLRVGGSIILENTTIEELHWPIEHSLIGRDVTLRGGQSVGGSYSLTLGDHSQIDMPGG